MIKIKAISASKFIDMSLVQRLEGGHPLHSTTDRQVDLSDQKIRCWQSSFFELLCLPSRSLEFQYVSMMRPTFLEDSMPQM